MLDERLQGRTKKFALSVIRLVKALPNDQVYWVLGRQLLRAGTSVGANTRAAYRGRSSREFVAKIGTVVEEADECGYWLELLEDDSVCPNGILDDLKGLMEEANQLTAIFSSIQKKYR